MKDMIGGEFFDYCSRYYGQGGIYGYKYTKGQILTGINSYFKNTNEYITWGGGDSIDRERVLLEMQRLFPNVQKLSEGL